jgi:putrescine aminotransferase
MEGLGDDPVVMSYAKHLNPVLVALGRRGGWVKTFVKGEGNYLWDDAGSRYLDFVAGCGAVNLGHNPPQISEALTETLKSLAPGFAQSSLNPLTARLADRIIQLAPPGLEMAFFCNCGTEAVEAALKLARIATGRTAIVYCSGSYHGKTLGSLSVTGHEPFQAPFAPLVPDCRKVAFGDLDELGQALQAKDVAAFIVEPVQGEHGSILPPAGYLRAAQDLCRASGTLFVVDEVQTGMGRTGALFACEHDGLDPDVLTLAKSLGGGLMPVGATLTRRDVWLKGYGTADRFALHTSTFSGGSLACAAGLAALESLSEESLLASVRSRGTRLLNGLQAVADEYPTIIREVRGKGLMMGLELCPLDEAIAGIVLQGIAADERPETKEFVGDPEALLDILPATLMMQHLLDVHQIYTLMARSNPFVLRVQPPLTLTEDEADKFVEAVQDGCRKLSNPVELLSQLMMQ